LQSWGEKTGRNGNKISCHFHLDAKKEKSFRRNVREVKSPICLRYRAAVAKKSKKGGGVQKKGGAADFVVGEGLGSGDKGATPGTLKSRDLVNFSYH